MLAAGPSGTVPIQEQIRGTTDNIEVQEDSLPQISLSSDRNRDRRSISSPCTGSGNVRANPACQSQMLVTSLITHATLSSKPQVGRNA